VQRKSILGEPRTEWSIFYYFIDIRELLGLDRVTRREGFADGRGLKHLSSKLL
jgi:hypothetical protein